MNDPYRPPEHVAAMTMRSPVDPLEAAAVDAIRRLEAAFASLFDGRWRNGNEIREIEIGFGEGVAKIVDSVRRLREQKMGVGG